jgi:F0F1-type ATP synthase assembly protein I
MAKGSPWAKSLGLFSVILSELLGFTGFGVLAGLAAQKYAHAPGWISIVTATLGFGLAMVRVYVISNRANEDEKQ